MFAPTIGSMKTMLISATGLSSETLHIYLGLAIFALVAIIVHKRYRMSLSWIVVLAVALLNELADLEYFLTSGEPWAWHDSLLDIAYTLLLPSSFLVLARHKWLTRPHIQRLR